MAAPLASYTRLPQDGSYTGKPVRMLGRLVGGDYVYQHVYSYISAAKINGMYYADSGAPSPIVATAHDGITTGFLWVQNPSASINMRIRRIEVAFTNATATAIVHDTAPRVAVARGTFTGTFNGATLTTAKRKTSDASSVGDIRTASTGATVSVGNVIWASIAPGNDITTADVYNLRYSCRWDWGDDDNTSEDEFIILAQNECAVIYQMDNGTTNDQRLVGFDVIWDEIDVT
jgi:hypothetical protein